MLPWSRKIPLWPTSAPRRLTGLCRRLRRTGRRNDREIGSLLSSSPLWKSRPSTVRIARDTLSHRVCSGHALQAGTSNLDSFQDWGGRGWLSAAWFPMRGQLRHRHGCMSASLNSSARRSINRAKFDDSRRGRFRSAALELRITEAVAAWWIIASACRPSAPVLRRMVGPHATAARCYGCLS